MAYVAGPEHYNILYPITFHGRLAINHDKLSTPCMHLSNLSAVKVVMPIVKSFRVQEQTQDFSNRVSTKGWIY